MEHNIKFTALSTTVSIPTPIPTPPSMPVPATPSGAPSIAPECQQPPAATNSGEEEVEVKDELVDATPPPEPAQQPHKSKSSQATQPMCQSLHVRKPLQYAKRLISREGTADGIEHRPPGWHADYTTDFTSITGLLPDFDSPNMLGAYHMDIEEAAAAAVQVVGGDPKSLCKAQSCSNWPSWKEAMDCELSTLKQAGMWETVLHPKDKNVIDCKWVYQTKYKLDGAIDKHKVRLVARGFTQVYRVDYLKTYSPVAKLASLWTILTLATCLGWDIICFNFNVAYLNGELEELEEIYMEQAPGYAEGGVGFIKRLKKVLYGLKQVGHRWYDTSM